jgi:hypothetical protein
MAPLIVMSILAVEPTAEERRACDQTVATILELERAIFLVRELRGGIGKRL